MRAGRCTGEVRRHGVFACRNYHQPGRYQGLPRQGFRRAPYGQDFADESFDLIWCRHCLEHSIFPYFTLAQFHRVLKPAGLLYIEVPASDTRAHQTNANHYCLFGKSMWSELLRRSGFNVLEITDISFTVTAGSDVYWAFVSRK